MTNDYGNLELHMVLLDAMKDIDSICREHGLKYYLYAGTLLGAVKHKGFIPWDDDVDIAMFPKDFYKLMSIINEKYSTKYEMCTFETNAQHYSKMNKLYIKETMFVTHNKGSETPLFIDIALYHNVPDRKIQRILQQKSIEFIMTILSVQAGFIVPTSMKSKLVLGTFSKIKREFWGCLMDKIMCLYDNRETVYAGIMSNTLFKSPYTGLSSYYNDMDRHEDLQKVIDLPFEGNYFMCFSNPEIDLDRHYGDGWRKPFPKEKRITKHDVKTYVISDEVKERAGITGIERK